jgi:hypothetical protein
MIGPTKEHVGYCKKHKLTGCGEFKLYPPTSKSENGWKPSRLDCGAVYGEDSAIVSGRFNYVENGEAKIHHELSVKAKCSDDEKMYSLEFKGTEHDVKGVHPGEDNKVFCDKEGVKEKNSNDPTKEGSTVKCEDPKEFCKARFGGRELCPNMCGNSGRCANIGNTTAGFLHSEAQVKRKMLGGTKTISLAESVSNKIGENGWACWCFQNEGFSTKNNESCPKVIFNE